jgi:8-oxo-dGTP diphosphatase
MIKVAAAVIKYEDKILLMRRAKNQVFSGFWEFPGGKVENGERVSAALKRELDEELGIKASVGKLITSVPSGKYEVYAYDVKYYDGLIRLSVHDDMEWVTLNEALQHRLLPADRKIINHMAKVKETKTEKKKESVWESHIQEQVSKPVFNKNTKKWAVAVRDSNQGPRTVEFDDQENAMDFYVLMARKVLSQFLIITPYTR